MKSIWNREESSHVLGILFTVMYLIYLMEGEFFYNGFEDLKLACIYEDVWETERKIIPLPSIEQLVKNWLRDVKSKETIEKL